MNKPDAKRTIAFMQLLHNFQTVERVAHAPDKIRYENDIEHSYLLAMMAWYLIDSLHLDLDKPHVLEYALAHDMVEVYAGDTYIFDEEAKKTKHDREEKARHRIASEFPEFPDLHATIAEYEKQSNNESRFVRALDKLLPVITNYIQEGRTWKEMMVTFEGMVENKRPRTAEHKEVGELFEQIADLTEKHKDRYFAI